MMSSFPFVFVWTVDIGVQLRLSNLGISSNKSSLQGLDKPQISFSVTHFCVKHSNWLVRGSHNTRISQLFGDL